MTAIPLISCLCPTCYQSKYPSLQPCGVNLLPICKMVNPLWTTQSCWVAPALSPEKDTEKPKGEPALRDLLHSRDPCRVAAGGQAAC